MPECLQGAKSRSGLPEHPSMPLRSSMWPKAQPMPVGGWSLDDECMGETNCCAEDEGLCFPYPRLYHPERIALRK